jgi:hypothetical protein
VCAAIIFDRYILKIVPEMSQTLWDIDVGKLWCENFSQGISPAF